MGMYQSGKNGVMDNLPTDIKFGKVVKLIPKTRKGHNSLQNKVNLWCIQDPNAIKPALPDLCLLELSPNGTNQGCIWVKKDNDPNFDIDWS